MKPGTDNAKEAGCTCSVKELPTKNFPYTPRNFVLYQPDCPVNGHGLFKRAVAKKKKAMSVNFKLPTPDYVNLDMGDMFNGMF